MRPLLILALANIAAAAWSFQPGGDPTEPTSRPIRSGHERRAEPTPEPAPIERRSAQGLDLGSYFGAPAAGPALDGELADLAGVWRVTVTRFGPEADRQTGSEPRARVSGRTSGIAERRWTLDGTLLVERYTLGGRFADLPHVASSFNAAPPDEPDADNPVLPETPDPLNSPLLNDMSGNPAGGGAGETSSDRDPTDSPLLDDMSEKVTGDRTPGRRSDPGPADDSPTPRRAGPDAESGIVLWSCDRGGYTLVWTDSQSPSLRIAHGLLDDRDRLILRPSPVPGSTGAAARSLSNGSENSRDGGPDLSQSGAARDSYAIIELDPDREHQVITVLARGGGGEPRKTMEIEYTRIRNVGSLVDAVSD